MVRPKLSRTLREELNVRDQLGISKRSARARGFQGARRARAELSRRQRYERQRGTGWDDLGQDLINLILAHLTVVDLYHVRLSGLGGVSVARRFHLRRIMRARVAALYPVYRAALPVDKVVVSPTQFSRRASLHLINPTAPALRAVGRDMHAVAHLDAGGVVGAGALTTVPDELSRCQRLETLSLQGHALSRVPSAVLALHGLRALVLHGNAQLDSLPRDIGMRLPRLRTIGLLRTKVDALPRSLLATLERNLSRRGRASGALLVSRAMFAHGYLERTVCGGEYPRLAKNTRRHVLSDDDGDDGLGLNPPLPNPG